MRESCAKPVIRVPVRVLTPPAKTYVQLVMRIELIVRNARNPHIVINFIRLARHLELFSGIRIIDCI